VRIMYIIDSLKFGGAEMLLLAMVRQYAAEHDISVVYFTPGPLEDDIRALNVPVHRISTRGMKDPRVIPRLVAMMRQEKPDVVHTHLSKSDVAGLMAAAMAGVPARISSIHNVDPWRQKKLLSEVMKQWTKTCHHMIAVSEGVREYVLEWSDYPPEKITTIDNGIDLGRFDPATVSPIDKMQFGIPEDALTVSMVARLEESKGHHILLEAAAKVVKAMPSVYFMIVGDGHLRPALEAQRDSLGLQDNVIFTGVQRDIPGVMRAVDIITFSSLWEGLPVALLEAMAMANPVVSTSVGGIPKVITDGEDGLLVPKEDADALATKLLKVLYDNDLRAHMGQNARQTIEREYSSAAMHRQILDLYEKTLAQNRETA
jgi:glycosyltransferase involved in cell wall biosynthesis